MYVAFVFPCAVGTGKNGLLLPPLRGVKQRLPSPRTGNPCAFQSNFVGLDRGSTTYVRCFCFSLCRRHRGKMDFFDPPYGGSNKGFPVQGLGRGSTTYVRCGLRGVTPPFPYGKRKTPALSSPTLFLGSSSFFFFRRRRRATDWIGGPQRMYVAFVFPCAVGTGKNGLLLPPLTGGKTKGGVTPGVGWYPEGHFSPPTERKNGPPMQSNLSWTAKPTQRMYVAFVFPCAVGTGKNGLLLPPVRLPSPRTGKP